MAAIKTQDLSTQKILQFSQKCWFYITVMQEGYLYIYVIIYSRLSISDRFREKNDWCEISVLIDKLTVNNEMGLECHQQNCISFRFLWSHHSKMGMKGMGTRGGESVSEPGAQYTRNST